MIRPEQEQDRSAIRSIHIEAFRHHPFSHQTEHRIVEELRASHALSLSLVAELDGAAVGHVAFSPARIEGEMCDWYVLGPIGVLPERQRQGIGSALVRAGLESLCGLGAGGCVLVGDPAFYRRFGFGPATGMRMEGVPEEVFQALSFQGHSPQGQVEHHAAFLVEP